MGIKDFLNVVIGDKTIRDLGITVKKNFITGKKVVVDAFNVIYQSRFATENMTANGNVTSHIKIVLSKIMMLEKLDVTQMWVFDGGHNVLKEECVNNRTGPKITKQEVLDIKQVLSLYGIKYVTVSTEAEFFCAELVIKGMFDYVWSTDMDVIIRGGNIMKSIGQELYILCAHNVYEVISQADLAKIAVMLGCDFAPKTPRVGPKNALKKLNSNLTERQLLALNFLRSPINMRSVIMENPSTNPNKTALCSWLMELGFGEKTLAKIKI